MDTMSLNMTAIYSTRHLALVFSLAINQNFTLNLL